MIINCLTIFNKHLKMIIKGFFLNTLMQKKINKKSNMIIKIFKFGNCNKHKITKQVTKRFFSKFNFFLIFVNIFVFKKVNWV